MVYNRPLISTMSIMNGSRNRGEPHGKWRSIWSKGESSPLIDQIRSDQIPDDFPHLPTWTKGLDVIAEHELPDQTSEENAYPTQKPSIKNMRRTVTTNELLPLQEINPYERRRSVQPRQRRGWVGSDCAVGWCRRATT
jgi:hypothetical protein